jgi:hypothetical protein
MYTLHVIHGTIKHKTTITIKITVSYSYRRPTNFLLHVWHKMTTKQILGDWVIRAGYSDNVCHVIRISSTHINNKQQANKHKNISGSRSVYLDSILADYVIRIESSQDHEPTKVCIWQRTNLLVTEYRPWRGPWINFRELRVCIKLHETDEHESLKLLNFWLFAKGYNSYPQTFTDI